MKTPKNTYLKQKVGMYDHFMENTIILRHMYDTLLERKSDNPDPVRQARRLLRLF